MLTAMVTGCLVDGRPMDGEFRIVRPDGDTRTLHMTGEPVLDAEGCTASMWAVLRDVSELRRSEQAVTRSRASVQREEHIERAEHRMAVELQETVLPPWRGFHCASRRRAPAPWTSRRTTSPPRRAGSSAATGTTPWSCRTDARSSPSATSPGTGSPPPSAMAMLLGALRGMAVAGIEPGALMGHLRQPGAGDDDAARAGQCPVLPLRPRNLRSLLGAGRSSRAAALPRRFGAAAAPAGRDTAGCRAAGRVRAGRGTAVPRRRARSAHRRADPTRRPGCGPGSTARPRPFGSQRPVRHGRMPCGASSRSSAGPSAWTTRACWSPASGREGTRTDQGMPLKRGRVRV
ncbi:hypothetical protein SBADM41S_12040 [Streptomyces badius]